MRVVHELGAVRDLVFLVIRTGLDRVCDERAIRIMHPTLVVRVRGPLRRVSNGLRSHLLFRAQVLVLVRVALGRPLRLQVVREVPQAVLLGH